MGTGSWIRSLNSRSIPGGRREVQQGVKALGRAVWVDGLGGAPFPVGAGGDEGGSSLSFVLGSYSSRLVDTHTHTQTHTHTHTPSQTISLTHQHHSSLRQPPPH